MKLFSLLSSLLLATSTVFALPLEERQLNGRLATTGGGPVRPRFEIRQLKDTRPNQYALLVLALSRWQRLPQSDRTGYFGISSIHGVPRDNYNNFQPCNGCTNMDGYGVHDMVLFPMWHRVYLRTFEQELLKIVQQVASEYPESQRATMRAAANELRFPFYDAARRPPQGRPAFPRIISDFSVTVNGPRGRTTFNNPFFRFDIPDPSQFVYFPFTQRFRTYRYPNTNDRNAASNTQAGINAMANMRQSFADQFYGLFTNCRDWLHFSNDAAGSSSSSCATSVELLHNSIHNVIGGVQNGDVLGGHMTYLPLSSYDPAFWLHHSNIDRIIAMWQTLNPNQFGDTQRAPHNTWTLPQGTTVGPSTPLNPFVKTDGSNWVGNDVRDWRVLGYTYPEYVGTSGDAAAIRRAVNNLYGPGANRAARRDLDKVVSNVGDLVDTVGDIINNTASLLLDGNPLVAKNGSLFQYQANVYTPRYVLNGSYNVMLFNGNPADEQNTAGWLTASNLIGFVGVLSMPGMTSDDLLMSGSIPLTRTLQELTSSQPSILADLTEQRVAPFLAENLQWRIQGPKGEPVDPSTVEGFVVSVYTSSATQPASDDDFPVFSDFINLLDVTKDHAGGANSTEQAEPHSVLDVVSSLLSSVASD